MPRHINWAEVAEYPAHLEGGRFAIHTGARIPYFDDLAMRSKRNFVLMYQRR